MAKLRLSIGNIFNSFVKFKTHIDDYCSFFLNVRKLLNVITSGPCPIKAKIPGRVEICQCHSIMQCCDEGGGGCCDEGGGGFCDEDGI